MTALATITPTESEYSVIREQAESLVKTGFLPQAIKTPEQAIAIILTGRELGIPAMTALNGINVIQGKPTVSPQLMLGLIERSGQLDDIKIDSDEDSVTVTMKRKGRSPHTETFGFEEAKAMGLMTKDNYRKQALTMYKWRAVSAAARVVFPDVILGMYTHEELAPDASFNSEGEFIESDIAPAPKAEKVEVVEAEVIEESKPKKGKKKVGDDELRKAEWIAYCGNGLRAINNLGTATYWNVESINAHLETQFGVTGGIQSLSLAQVEQFAKQIDEWFMVLTDDHDDRNLYDGDGEVIGQVIQ